MINIDDRITDELDSDEMFLLIQISRFMNNEKKCWPSMKTLYTKCRWSEDKLKQVRKRLLAKKAIEEVRKGNGRKSCIYKINANIGLFLGGGEKSPSGNLPSSEDRIIPPSEGGHLPSPEGDKLPPELLGIEPLGKQLLVNDPLTRKEERDRFTREAIFDSIKEFLFPGVAEKSETEMQLRTEAAKIFDYYSKYKSNPVEYRSVSKAIFPEANDQIKAYRDYHLILKKEPVRVPHKVMEFITMHDWCGKLYSLCTAGKYEPLKVDDVESSWLIDAFYYIGTYYENKSTGKVTLDYERE